MFSGGSVTRLRDQLTCSSYYPIGRFLFSGGHAGTRRECNPGHYKNRPHSPLKHATCRTMNTKTFHGKTLEYFKVNQI